MEKVSHILGMGEISMTNIEHFMNEGSTYKQAKVEAAKEFLGYFLGYMKEELEEMSITETQLGGREKDILYTAFADKDDIKEIRRLAECANEDIIIRDFIPPQMFDRFKYLNKICQDMRSRDPELKSQISFGVKDVEIFTRTRNSKEPYRKTPLEELADLNDIPSFDHSLKWQTKPDRPPRRNILYKNQSRPSSATMNRTSRQSSTDSDKQVKKRSKVDMSDKNDKIQPTGRIPQSTIYNQSKDKKALTNGFAEQLRLQKQNEKLVNDNIEKIEAEVGNLLDDEQECQMDDNEDIVEEDDEIYSPHSPNIYIFENTSQNVYYKKNKKNV